MSEGVDKYVEGKISIEKCRKILNRNGNKYTDEQIKIIRDFLYVLGDIDYINFQEHCENGKKSNNIYQGINR